MASALDDPWLAAQVDAAIAPYKDRWPPEAVAIFREEIAESIKRDPMLVRFFQEAHPDQSSNSSDVASVFGSVEDERKKASGRARSK